MCQEEVLEVNRAWNSLKQDLLHKPTLQSGHRQIDSIRFFCNEQAARRLWYVGISSMLHFSISIYPFVIYVIYMAESSCRFHFPHTMG